MKKGLNRLGLENEKKENLQSQTNKQLKDRKRSKK